MPKISVLTPNFNNVQYLAQRFDSILNQTFYDFEVIVVDNYSDDGAWDLIREYSNKDPRIKIFQAKKIGMYNNWNNCIEKAKGEYIYIATSDDTMDEKCLEIMHDVLENNIHCGICHCLLKIIDENGNKHPEYDWYNYKSTRFYEKYLNKKHIRRAPLDGILHFGLHTVYTSITQLLIRKKVFEKIGCFDNSWGSMGDFEWEMRASLLFDTIYVPIELATWRKHSNQATLKFIQHKTIYNFQSMISSVLEKTEKLNPEIVNEISKNKTLCLLIYRKEKFYLEFKKERSYFFKIVIFLKYLFRDPFIIVSWIKYVLLKKMKLINHNFILRYKTLNDLISLFRLNNHIEII